LIALHADMDAPLPNPKKPKTESTMLIEGIVTGDKIRFETELASFMLTIDDSPLFKPRCQK
jgi:hypothetical protein